MTGTEGTQKSGPISKALALYTRDKATTASVGEDVSFQCKWTHRPPYDTYPTWLYIHELGTL
jgi:hypothetical protein